MLFLKHRIPYLSKQVRYLFYQSKLLHFKHWFSDVVTGAGIGILSTKLAYIAYPIVKRHLSGSKGSKLMLVPSYQRGFLGCSIAAQLN